VTQGLGSRWMCQSAAFVVIESMKYTVAGVVIVAVLLVVGLYVTVRLWLEGVTYDRYGEDAADQLGAW
jgi:hypothetical protein